MKKLTSLFSLALSLFIMDTVEFNPAQYRGDRQKNVMGLIEGHSASSGAHVLQDY